MPAILAMIGGFFLDLVKSINPVEWAKTIARVSIAIGLFASFIGFGALFVHAVSLTLSLFIEYSDNLNTAVSSAESGLSCFAWFMTELGLVHLFNSFLVSAFGLFTLWAGFRSGAYSVRFLLSAKKFLFKVLE